MSVFALVPKSTKNPITILKWVFRYFKIVFWGVKLENQHFSILSNNCLGGMITHDFLQPQLSPTVNLFMYPSDYIRFLTFLDESLHSELKQLPSDKPYPLGELNGCAIHFMHYHSFKDAAEKWRIRSKRINYDNLLVIMVERDGCTYEHLAAFDKLSFKHKIAVVHKPYPDIQSAVVIPGYEDCQEVGTITDWSSKLGGGRIYDRINWVDILNQVKY